MFQQIPNIINKISNYIYYVENSMEHYLEHLPDYFLEALSASILRIVFFAQSLPSFPPQARNAWYALEVLSLLLATSISLSSCRANHAIMVLKSSSLIGFPDIRARAVNTPFDGFPSSPTIAFLEGTDWERISKPFWALRFTDTGGIVDIGISLHPYNFKV